MMFSAADLRTNAVKFLPLLSAYDVQDAGALHSPIFSYDLRDWQTACLTTGFSSATFSRQFVSSMEFIATSTS